MNNIYVEINEKCCSRCDAECDGCWLEELITDRLAEERKKVVQKIREKLSLDEDYVVDEDGLEYIIYHKSGVDVILDTLLNEKGE